jgi:hypothetical protein
MKRGEGNEESTMTSRIKTKRGTRKHNLWVSGREGGGGG